MDHGKRILPEQPLPDFSLLSKAIIPEYSPFHAQSSLREKGNESGSFKYSEVSLVNNSQIISDSRDSILNTAKSFRQDSRLDFLSRLSQQKFSNKIPSLEHTFGKSLEEFPEISLTSETMSNLVRQVGKESLSKFGKFLFDLISSQEVPGRPFILFRFH